MQHCKEIILQLKNLKKKIMSRIKYLKYWKKAMTKENLEIVS